MSYKATMILFKANDGRMFVYDEMGSAEGLHDGNRSGSFQLTNIFESDEKGMALKKWYKYKDTPYRCDITKYRDDVERLRSELDAADLDVLDATSDIVMELLKEVLLREPVVLYPVSQVEMVPVPVTVVDVHGIHS